MRTKILVVDNYDSFTWNLIHLIEQLEMPYHVCQNDSIPWEELNEYSHFLLSPGPGLPSESADLMKLLDVVVGKRNVLGVCLGFQALAEHYGARLKNLISVRHGVQKQLKEIKGPLYKEIESMSVGLYHSWALDMRSLDSELILSAFCEDNIPMSFHHRIDSSFAVQFHPESIMSTDGLKLMQNWLEISKSFPMSQLHVG